MAAPSQHLVGGIPGVRGRLKTGRDHSHKHRGLEKTTAGGSPAGWQWGGPGAERPTLESPAQPGGCGRMGCIWNEPFRGCPRQNRGLNWGGGGDLSRQQWAEATLRWGRHPRARVQTGATEPPAHGHPAEASLAVTSYKGCAKSSECDSGLFGITVNPENYMGSRRRCCQKDGCNQDPLPGKPQLSLMAGVPPCPPLPPRASCEHLSLTCAVTGQASSWR